MNAVIPLFILMGSHYESQHHRQRAMNQLLSYEIKIESPPPTPQNDLTLFTPTPNKLEGKRGGAGTLLLSSARGKDNGHRLDATCTVTCWHHCLSTA